MDDQAAEIMPRPPASHRPVTHDEPTGLLTALSEQLRQATELHERFLATQARLQPRLTSTAPTRTAQTEVEIGAWYLDGAGRMMAGAVAREVLALLPYQDGAIDCGLTFHRELPAPGERLPSTLTVTGTSFQGGVDGRLSIHGTWSPSTDLGQPPHHVGACFGPDAVTALAEGRPADCFTGPEWALTRAHLRSPGIGPRAVLLLEEVTAFDAVRGLSADGRQPPDVWGSPMALLEGCLQAMTFHLAATGGTITRDGWRFEPVPDQPARVRWHARVPDGRPRYSVTVRSLTPDALQADVACTVDGRVVLRAEGLAVRLVPDTPLPHWRQLGPPTVQRTGDPIPLSALGGLRGHHDPAPVANVGPIRYDYPTLLAGAWGPLHEVFGDWGARGDDGFRLPGPPYLFITRLTEVSGPPGGLAVGSSLVAEYDVPEQVWFTEQSGTVPVAVLMEIMLQPCGCLTAYVGSALTSQQRLYIRNLDGELTTVGEVAVTVRSVRTTVELVQLDRWDDTVLETFRIRCEVDDVLVLEGTAVFALSPAAALAQQTGMAVTDADQERLSQPCERPVVDLRSRPARWFGHSARLPGPMLLMLDRITGYWPDGGRAGLGRLRAETEIRADAWYFKAHFFTDPVQPGSLGVEAMFQLLQYYLIERGVGDGFRFAPEVPASWTYRGQVIPADSVVTIEMDVLEVVLGADGGHAEAEAWLWVDGRRSYRVPRLRVRVVPGHLPAPAVVETVLDPANDRWLADHCPTWTVPAVPLMSIVDMLAQAARDYTGRDVRVLRDVQLQRWLPVTAPTRLRLTCLGDAANLSVWHEAGTLSRFTPVATATIEFDPPPRPDRLPPLPSWSEAALPYEADLFHGPSFQYLTSLRMGPTGASGVLRPDQGSVPRGLLHQGVLDAALHVIPHTDLWRWHAAIGRGVFALPHRIARLAVFEPLPDIGEIEVEARCAGLLPGEDHLVVVDLQLCVGQRVLVAFQVVLVMIPVGPLTAVPGPARRAYLQDGEPNPDLLISVVDNGETVVRRHDVERIDQLRGTANAVYGLPAGTRATDWLPHIAVKEHIARRTGVHPRTVEVTNLDNVSWDNDTARVRTP